METITLKAAREIPEEHNIETRTLFLKRFVRCTWCEKREKKSYPMTLAGHTKCRNVGELNKANHDNFVILIKAFM